MDKARAYVRVPHIVVCSGLSMQAKATYAVLMAYSDSTGSACVGMDRLSGCLNVSARMVSEYIKELCEAGFVTVHRQGMKKANMYQMTDFCGLPIDDEKHSSLQSDEAKHSSSHDPHQTGQNETLQSSEAKQTSVKNNKDNKDIKEDNIETLKKEICSAEPSVAQSRLSHTETAYQHIREAREGSRKWKDVTDRDFTLYYIGEHNRMYQHKLAFDRYRDVGVIRDVVMTGNQIPREMMAVFIDTILSDYHQMPNRYDRLSINMLANRTRDIASLIDSVRAKIQPIERKYRYNDFGQVSQTSVTPDSVF